MSERNKNGTFWLGFFAGGLLGGFLIFLLGTKEGKKLAEKIEGKAEDYEKDLEKKIVKLQNRGEEFLSQAQEVKEHVMEEIEGSKKAVSDNLVSKMDQTLTTIENMQKKGVALTEEVHRRYFKRNGKPLIS